MDWSTCADALTRALRYLECAGVEPSPETTRAAWRILSELVEESDACPADARLFEAAMARLRERFDLGPGEIPPPAPPIRRSSIGFGGREKR